MADYSYNYPSSSGSSSGGGYNNNSGSYTNQNTGNFGSILGGLGAGVANSLAIGATTAYNSAMQSRLMQAGIDNLTSFAQQVAAQNNPDLTAFINQNIQLAQQGKISPAQAMSAVQQKSQMYGVKVPQNFTDATNNALAQEAQVAQEGYTPVERSQIQGVLQGVIGQQEGEQAAIDANQQARGQYGGGQALDAETTNLQGLINNASNTANQTEANAYQRALTALTNEGQLGLSAGQQSFSQNAATATAQDAINSLNTQLTQQANLANTSNEQATTLLTAQQQQARDLANQQAELALNTQNVGAANETVQNLQGQENIAGGALKQAGSDAATALPSTMQRTATGVAGTASNVLGNPGVTQGVGSALNGLKNIGGGGTGSNNGYGSYKSGTNNSGYGSSGGTSTTGTDYTTGSSYGGYAEGGQIGTNVPIFRQPTYTPPQSANLDSLQLNAPTISEPVDIQNLLAGLANNQTSGSPPSGGGLGAVATPITATPATPIMGANPIQVNRPELPARNGIVPPRPHEPMMHAMPVGDDNRQMYSKGGKVIGPGDGESDDVPVRLSNGEYVINADSTSKYHPLVEAINDDDHSDILDSLMAHICPTEEHTLLVVGPKGKEIDGQKALSDALRAMARVSD